MKKLMKHLITILISLTMLSSICCSKQSSKESKGNSEYYNNLVFKEGLPKYFQLLNSDIHNGFDLRTVIITELESNENGIAIKFKQITNSNGTPYDFTSFIPHDNIKLIYVEDIDENMKVGSSLKLYIELKD